LNFPPRLAVAHKGRAERTGQRELLVHKC